MHVKRDRLRQAWERGAEWPLTGLALCYLAAYAIPILDPRLPPIGRRLAEGTMWATWAAFAVAYFVRLALSDHRWHFIWHHLLDAAIICLPLLRPLGLLRLMSALRILNRQATGSF